MEVRERYRVILADPPWQYRNFADSAHGAAVAHYKTMTIEDIAAIPVGSWADPSGAVLLLWATWPKLPEAMRLIEAWGFRYVTGIPWVKVTPSSGEIRRGIGFWTMSSSEMLLIATTGKVVRENINGGKDKPLGLLIPGGEERVFWAPIGRHSAKPLEIHTWAEGTLSGPYLELFARRERPGWTCWGRDLGYELSERGVERSNIIGGEPGALAGSGASSGSLSDLMLEV